MRSAPPGHAVEEKLHHYWVRYQGKTYTKLNNLGTIYLVRHPYQSTWLLYVCRIILGLPDTSFSFQSRERLEVREKHISIDSH